MSLLVFQKYDSLPAPTYCVLSLMFIGWLVGCIWRDIGEYHNILPQYPVLYTAPKDNRVCLFDFLLISNSPSETCHSSTTVVEIVWLERGRPSLTKRKSMAKLCGLEQDLLLFLAF